MGSPDHKHKKSWLTTLGLSSSPSSMKRSQIRSSKEPIFNQSAEIQATPETHKVDTDALPAKVVQNIPETLDSQLTSSNIATVTRTVRSESKHTSENIEIEVINKRINREWKKTAKSDKEVIQAALLVLRTSNAADQIKPGEFITKTVAKHEEIIARIQKNVSTFIKSIKSDVNSYGPNMSAYLNCLLNKEIGRITWHPTCQLPSPSNSYQFTDTTLAEVNKSIADRISRIYALNARLINSQCDSLVRDVRAVGKYAHDRIDQLFDVRYTPIFSPFVTCGFTQPSLTVGEISKLSLQEFCTLLLSRVASNRGERRSNPSFAGLSLTTTLPEIVDSKLQKKYLTVARYNQWLDDVCKWQQFDIYNQAYLMDSASEFEQFLQSKRDALHQIVTKQLIPLYFNGLVAIARNQLTDTTNELEMCFHDSNPLVLSYRTEGQFMEYEDALGQMSLFHTRDDGSSNDLRQAINDKVKLFDATNIQTMIDFLTAILAEHDKSLDQPTCIIINEVQQVLCSLDRTLDIYRRKGCTQRSVLVEQDSLVCAKRADLELVKTQSQELDDMINRKNIMIRDLEEQLKCIRLDIKRKSEDNSKIDLDITILEADLVRLQADLAVKATAGAARQKVLSTKQNQLASLQKSLIQQSFTDTVTPDTQTLSAQVSESIKRRRSSLRDLAKSSVGIIKRLSDSSIGGNALDDSIESSALKPHSLHRPLQNGSAAPSTKGHNLTQYTGAARDPTVGPKKHPKTVELPVECFPQTDNNTAPAKRPPIGLSEPHSQEIMQTTLTARGLVNSSATAADHMTMPRRNMQNLSVPKQVGHDHDDDSNIFVVSSDNDEEDRDNDSQRQNPPEITDGPESVIHATSDIGTVGCPPTAGIAETPPHNPVHITHIDIGGQHGLMSYVGKGTTSSTDKVTKRLCKLFGIPKSCLRYANKVKIESGSKYDFEHFLYVVTKGSGRLSDGRFLDTGSVICGQAQCVCDKSMKLLLYSMNSADPAIISLNPINPNTMESHIVSSSPTSPIPQQEVIQHSGVLPSADSGFARPDLPPSAYIDYVVQDTRSSYIRELSDADEPDLDSATEKIDETTPKLRESMHSRSGLPQMDSNVIGGPYHSSVNIPPRASDSNQVSIHASIEAAFPTPGVLNRHPPSDKETGVLEIASDVLPSDDRLSGAEINEVSVERDSETNVSGHDRLRTIIPKQNASVRNSDCVEAQDHYDTRIASVPEDDENATVNPDQYDNRGGRTTAEHYGGRSWRFMPVGPMEDIIDTHDRANIPSRGRKQRLSHELIAQGAGKSSAADSDIAQSVDVISSASSQKSHEDSMDIPSQNPSDTRLRESFDRSVEHGGDNLLDLSETDEVSVTSDGVTSSPGYSTTRAAEPLGAQGIQADGTTVNTTTILPDVLVSFGTQAIENPSTATPALIPYTPMGFGDSELKEVVALDDKGGYDSSDAVKPYCITEPPLPKKFSAITLKDPDQLRHEIDAESPRALCDLPTQNRDNTPPRVVEELTNVFDVAHPDDDDMESFIGLARLDTQEAEHVSSSTSSPECEQTHSRLSPQTDSLDSDMYSNDKRVTLSDSQWVVRGNTDHLIGPSSGAEGSQRSTLREESERFEHQLASGEYGPHPGLENIAVIAVNHDESDNNTAGLSDMGSHSSAAFAAINDNRGYDLPIDASSMSSLSEPQHCINASTSSVLCEAANYGGTQSIETGKEGLAPIVSNNTDVDGKISLSEPVENLTVTDFRGSVAGSNSTGHIDPAAPVTELNLELPDYLAFNLDSADESLTYQQPTPESLVIISKMREAQSARAPLVPEWKDAESPRNIVSDHEHDPGLKKAPYSDSLDIDKEPRSLNSIDECNTAERLERLTSLVKEPSVALLSDDHSASAPSSSEEHHRTTLITSSETEIRNSDSVDQHNASALVKAVAKATESVSFSLESLLHRNSHVASRSRAELKSRSGVEHADTTPLPASRSLSGSSDSYLQNHNDGRIISEHAWRAPQVHKSDNLKEAGASVSSGSASKSNHDANQNLSYLRIVSVHEPSRHIINSSRSGSRGASSEVDPFDHMITAKDEPIPGEAYEDSHSQTPAPHRRSKTAKISMSESDNPDSSQPDSSTSVFTTNTAGLKTQVSHPINSDEAVKLEHAKRINNFFEIPNVAGASDSLTQLPPPSILNHNQAQHLREKIIEAPAETHIQVATPKRGSEVSLSDNSQSPIAETGSMKKAKKGFTSKLAKGIKAITKNL